MHQPFAKAYLDKFIPRSRPTVVKLAQSPLDAYNFITRSTTRCAKNTLYGTFQRQLRHHLPCNIDYVSKPVADIRNYGAQPILSADGPERSDGPSCQSSFRTATDRVVPRDMGISGRRPLGVVRASTSPQL